MNREFICVGCGRTVAEKPDSGVGEVVEHQCPHEETCTFTGKGSVTCKQCLDERTGASVKKAQDHNRAILLGTAPPSPFPPIGPAIAQSIRITVEGKVFTDIVRHHWQEGNHGLALELLDCIQGITLKDALAVINGKKGFVGNSGGGWTMVDT